MTLVIQTIVNFINIYNILIIVYILSSWLPSFRYSRFMQVIAAMVEPYLALFKPLPFAQMGMLVLYPIYGLIFLQLLRHMLQMVISGVNPTLAGAMSYLVLQVGGMISSLFKFMALLAMIRFVLSLIFPRERNNIIIGALDIMILPSVRLISKIFTRRRLVSYHTLLFTAFIYFLLLAFLASAVAYGLAYIINFIPF